MIDVLKYAGRNLDEFSTFFDGSLTFKKPAKDVEMFSVAGRNGDLTISNNRFENIELTIPCFIRRHFKPNYSALIDFLSSTEGYNRLETTEEPDMFRLAQFKSAVEPNTGAFMHYGSFNLVFNCMPQLFYKDGEKEITLSSTTSLKNPSYKNAKPLFIVEGTGEIVVGNKGFRLNANTGTTIIDCELQDAYEGTINRNGDLILLNGFPELETGYNDVLMTGFTSAKIVPRWWRL